MLARCMNSSTGKPVAAILSGAQRPAVVALLVVSFPAATPALDYTSVAGGSGGTAYALGCPADMALVGIKGYAGSYIHGLQGTCAQINHDGSWVGRTVTTGFAGTSDGAAFDLTCPGGRVVSGFKGAAGLYVDRLTLRCGRLGPAGTLAAYGEHLDVTAGGTGGTSFGPTDCSNGQPARLLRGRAGTWIDSLGLGCGPVSTLKISAIRMPAMLQWSQQYRATVGARVLMSIVPTDDTTVELTSTNTSVARFPGDNPIWHLVVRRNGDGSSASTAPVEAISPGCTVITATYRGASIAKDLFVYDGDDVYLEFETPTTAIAGQPFDVSVRRRDVATAAERWSIALKNLDNVGMEVPDLATGTLPIPPGQVGTVAVPPGSTGARFQLTINAPGCMRVKATVGDHSVIRPVKVGPALQRPVTIRRPVTIIRP